jgi:23S rRNA pseudouridine1911/1915/1917 synthase
MGLVAGESIVEVEFVVEPNYAGWRLDKYLCEKIRRLSRTRVQQVIERDLICDRKLKSSTLVTPGLTFRLRKLLREEPATPLDFRVVYEDDDLFVVDKPAGLPIHATARYHHNTLVALMGLRFGDQAQPYPAHRLDRETSGLVVCGRHAEANRRLMRQFVRGEVKKQYLALCEGAPGQDAFSVDAPISEGGEFIRIAVRIDPLEGKPARTDFKVEQRFSRGAASFAVLRAFPQTGRQHQIRVHLRHAGFPLVGDKIYGPDEGYFDRFSKRTLEPEAWERLRLSRHALHAAVLTFAHPMTQATLELRSELPGDLQAFIEGADAATTPAEALLASTPPEPEVPTGSSR